MAEEVYRLDFLGGNAPVVQNGSRLGVYLGNVVGKSGYVDALIFARLVRAAAADLELLKILESGPRKQSEESDEFESAEIPE